MLYSPFFDEQYTYATYMMNSKSLTFTSFSNTEQTGWNRSVNVRQVFNLKASSVVLLPPHTPKCPD